METLVPFLTVVLICTLALVLYLGRRREELAQEQALNRRIRSFVPSLITVTERMPLARPRATPAPTATSDFLRSIDRWLAQAGMETTATKFLLLVASLGVGATAFTSLWVSGALALVYGVVAGALPIAYVHLQRKRRLITFSQQLPYVLDFLRSALSAGHTLLRGVQMATENAPEPIATELRLVVDQIQLGTSLADALDSMFRRAPEESLGFLVAAIRVQAEVGSSISEILDRVTDTIRDRQRLQQEIMTLVAHERYDRSRAAVFAAGLFQPDSPYIHLSAVSQSVGNKDAGGGHRAGRGRITGHTAYGASRLTRASVMDPFVLSILIFTLTLLGGITLSQTLFGTREDLDERLSIQPGERSKIGAIQTHRLLRWRVRRLRETQAKSAPEQKLPDTLTQAGFRGVESVARFQLGRFAMMVAGVIIGLLFCVVTRKSWVLGAAGGFLAGYIVPTIVIGRLAKARRRKMTRELPDVLALIVVSLEAGIGVAEVLKLVGRETLRQGHVLGRELALTSAQMAAGMSFEDTLKDFGARTGVDEIRSLAALLIQSEKIGARLAPALRAAADLLNSRRRLAAEEAARKTSIKMLFPLVFFILPAMLLVILGPAVIQLMDVFRNR
jgi:tight adherence protein C